MTLAAGGCLACTSQDCHGKVKSFQLPDLLLAALSCAYFPLKKHQRTSGQHWNAFQTISLAVPPSSRKKLKKK